MSRRSAAPVVVLLLALELALAAVLVTRFVIDEPAPPPDPEAPHIEVVHEGEDTIQGMAVVRVLNTPGAGLTIELHRSDGDVQVLARGMSSAAWDSTNATNGPYTLVAARDEPVATLDVRVQNARKDVETTAAVVGASAAIAAGGSAIGSGLANQAAIAAAQIGKESLIAVGEDHLALRTRKRERRKLRSRIAVILTLLLVALFFPFEELDAIRFGPFFDALPVAGGVAATFVAGALGVEYVLGWASRARTRVRFLGAGAVSLALSSIVFRTPFGYPGYVEEIDDEDRDGSDDEPPHVEGIRALASMTVLLGLLIPFLLVGYRWHYGIVEQGMEIALVALATSALPVKPLPGYDIWHWRKAVALPYCIGAYLLYFGFNLAFLPAGLLVQLGIVGILFYILVFAWLRARSATPQPMWYLRTRQELQAAQADVRRMVPDVAHRASRAIERGVEATVAALAWTFRALVAGIVGIEGARRERRLRRLVQRAAADRATDMGRIMDQLEGLDDDAQYTIIDSQGNAHVRRVGDLRDEAIRVRLYAAFGKDVPGIVTVMEGDGARVVFLADE